jgi:hypothetical protein
MTSRNGSLVVALKTSQLLGTARVNEGKGAAPMATILRTMCAVLALATTSMAAEFPNAPSSVIRTDAAMIETTASAPSFVAASPEVKLIDKTFVGLAIVSAGSTFADSYTTLFARQNWRAGKTGVCNVEVQSAYLYGTHPTVGRAYAVASVKSIGSLAAAYYLRKHHNRFWGLPLVGNTIMSLQGVGQNLAACN